MQQTSSAPGTPRQGTWFQQWMLWTFTLLFGLLAYWLIGFVINDVGNLEGPQYPKIETALIPEALRDRETRLKERQSDLQRQVRVLQSRQSILGTSTAGTEKTMNQLLQFQKMNLEKDIRPTPAEQQALADSQRLFLSNQEQYQQLTSELSGLQEQLNTVELDSLAVEKELEAARIPVHEEFNRQWFRHQMTIAGIKLSVLIPLLVISALLLNRLRKSIYFPLILAFSIAVGVKVLIVMHEYFPARAFKYILIITFLLGVTRVLLNVIRSIAVPGLEILLKQYREAYEVFLCPICSFPIRRGPLKYLYWTRRSIKKLKGVPALPPEPEGAYCCPACSTRLYEECEACHQTRHSLLPTCEHCGTTRNLPAMPTDPASGNALSPAPDSAN